MIDERSEPRISVNKLGEYLVASPSRRRRIVADQKRPKPFIVSRYRAANDAMVAFLEQGATDDAILLNAIESLASKPVETEFLEQDRDLSIEAISSMLDLADQIDLSDVECRRASSDDAKMVVAGVSVSVRPDIIVESPSRHPRPNTGLLRVYLSKTNPLTEEAGQYIGTVLRQFGADYMALGEAVDHRRCWVLDVFAGRIHLAPRSFKRRQNDIEAACEEIARAWSVA